MTNEITDPKAWEPVVAQVQGTEAGRAAVTDVGRRGAYTDIVAQFDVGSNPRYVRGHANPGKGDETYCNIYLCDVMSACGVTLPHWVDPATGAPTPMGKGKETDANEVCLWMAQHALSYEWMECSEIKARARATAGYPTCVTWLNPPGIGHVAVVLPGLDFTHIAQSGAVNFFDGNLRTGFGAASPLRFWTHD